MPSNVFAYSSKDHVLLKNEDALLPEFLPDRLLHRDNEINSLVFALKPLTENRRAQNVFVYGPTGTGKTISARLVLRELQEFSSRVQGIYLNCFQVNSRHMVLVELARALYCVLPSRGVSSEEIFDYILQALRKNQITLVLILDEVDQLMADQEASKLFYDLLRADVSNKPALVLISNDALLLSRLDARVKSSLSLNSIEFKSYTPLELKDILRSRIELAFFPNTVDPDAINVTAAFAAKNKGDARIALEVILRAGRLAERENSKTLTVDHARSVFPDISSRYLLKAENSLDDNDRAVLQLLCKQPVWLSGDLFEAYSETASHPLSERRFRDKLTRLADMHLISLELRIHGIKGKTREVKLLIPSEKLKEYV